MSLSNSVPEGKLSTDMVKAALLNEEARRKDLSGFNHSKANVILDSNRGSAKNKDFSHNRDKSRGRSKSKFKGNIICHTTTIQVISRNSTGKRKEVNPRRGKKRHRLQLLAAKRVRWKSYLSTCS